VRRGELIAAFSWDAGVCGGAMLLCSLTLVGKAGFCCERAGLGARGVTMVTCCHDFLITARGFAGFMALIDQINATSVCLVTVSGFRA
jgi:hypothetical protein